MGVVIFMWETYVAMEIMTISFWSERNDPFKNIAWFKGILNYFDKVVQVEVLYNLWIMFFI